MKFTEYEITEVQKLTEQLIKDMHSDTDPKCIKLTLENLKSTIDIAIFLDAISKMKKLEIRETQEEE